MRLAACHLRIIIAVAGTSSALQGVSAGDASGRPPSNGFEENCGQFAPSIRYAARLPQATVGVTPAELLLLPHGSAAARVSFVAARAHARVSADEPTGQRIHYVRPGRVGGPVCSLSGYSRLRVAALYPGIDWVIYFKGGSIEHDWIVYPGASPAAIRLRVDGFRHASLNQRGDLVLDAGSQRIIWRKPLAYQRINQTERIVSADYRLGNGELTLAVGAYDHALPLVVDPVLEFVHMVAGSDIDQGQAIAVDSGGSVYLAGITRSPDFQTTPGVVRGNRAETSTTGEIFVRKLSPSGDRILYSTYVGPFASGILEQRVLGMAVDGTGNVYLAFNAFNLPAAGSAVNDRGVVGLVKLGPNGDRILYSTRLLPTFSYLFNLAIAVDATGSAYVALGDSAAVVVTKVDPTGQRAEYEHRIETGQSLEQQPPLGLALGPDRSIYVAGATTLPAFAITPGAYRSPTSNPQSGDAFVVRIDPSGRERLLSTVLGGDSRDRGTAIAVDGQGNIYVGGSTLNSSGLRPMQGETVQSLPRRDGFSGFLVKLNPQGTQALFETILPIDSVRALAVDSEGNAFAAGAFQFAPVSALTLTKLDPSGRLLHHCTVPAGGPLVGGLAWGPSGALWIAGSTTSFRIPDSGPDLNLPTNAFVSRIAAVPPEADLDLQVETAPARDLAPGDEITYLLSIRNNGPERATDVLIAASQFEGGSYSSCRALGRGFCSSDLRAPYVNFSSIPVGSVGQVQLKRSYNRVDSNGTLVPFTASLVASSADSNLANNFVRSEKRARYVTLSISASPSDAVYRIDDSPALVRTFDPRYFPADSKVSITFPSPQLLSRGPAIFRRWTDDSTDNPRIFNLGSTNVSASAIFENTSTPYVDRGAIVNGASFAPGPVSPGEVVTLFGFNLGPGFVVGAQLDSENRLRTQLAGLRVLFDDAPAPIVYASAGQASVVVPYSVAGRESVRLRVEYNQNRSEEVRVAIAQAAPGLFTANSSGRGQVAAFNQDGATNSRNSPAARGSVVVLYATGEGITSPQLPDGGLVGPELTRPSLQPVSVSIGGLPAEVLYSGGVPGQVAGLMQINARVPANVEPGNNVPVTMSVGRFAGPGGTTLAIR